MDIVIIFLLGLCGMFMYRWRGMDESTVPAIFKSQQFRRVLCSMLIGLGVIAAGGLLPPWMMVADLPLYVNMILTVLLVTLVTLPGIVIGHGSYFINEQTQVDNEIFSFITKLIEDPMTDKTKMFGMFLTAFVSTLPVVLLTTIAWWWMFAAILKPIGYYIGFKMEQRGVTKLPIGTEFAEYWWGFWMVFSVVIG